MNVLACACTTFIKSQYLYCVFKILLHSVRVHSNKIDISCVIVTVQTDGPTSTSRPPQTLKEIILLTQNVHLRPIWSRQQSHIARVSILLVYFVL